VKVLAFIYLPNPTSRASIVGMDTTVRGDRSRLSQEQREVLRSLDGGAHILKLKNRHPDPEETRSYHYVVAMPGGWRYRIGRPTFHALDRRGLLIEVGTGYTSRYKPEVGFGIFK
jgi:hypothetical protein